MSKLKEKKPKDEPILLEKEDGINKDGIELLAVPKIGKKKGRPRKYAPGEEPYLSKGQKEESAKQARLLPRPLVKSLIQAPYLLLAKKYGEHWALSDAEAENMIEPHLELAEQFLPEWAKDNAAIMSVCFFHSMCIVARVEMSKTIARKKAELEDAANQTSPEG